MSTHFTADDHKALCCFPIESKSRDFDSRLYLALRFIRGGYAALVGSKGGVHKFMATLGLPFIYFSKGVNYQSLDMLDQLRRDGGIVVSLDEENYTAVDHDVLDYMIQGRNEQAILDRTSLLFVWSERMREKILSYADGFSAEDVVVTGNARFDLRRPAFNPLFDTGLPDRLGVRPGFILINTSFGAGNHVLGTDHFLKKAQYNYRDLYDEDVLMGMHRYKKTLAYAFRDMARAVAEAFPERDVVLRPHPSEDTALYDPLHRAPENLHVTREGLSQEWVAASKLLIHHDCTTGLEAIFNETPVFSYCPVLKMEYAKNLAVLASVRTDTEEELIGHLKALFSGEKTFAPSQESMAHLKNSVDCIDYSAGERVFETVDRRRDGMFRKARAFTPTSTTTTPHQSAPSNPDEQDETTKRRYEQYRKNKFTDLTAEEVRAMATRLHATDPSLPAVEVTDLGNEGFLLTGSAS